jgi:hypothetical protein
MKVTLFLSLLAITSTLVYSQGLKLPTDSVTNKVAFTVVQDVASTSQSELYSRAKIWFVNNFRDAKEVVQLDDKENGLIMGKGNFYVSYGFMGLPVSERMNFTVSIRVKDNKFKAQITGMQLRSEPSKYQPTAIDTPVELYNTEKPNKNKTIQKIIAATIEQSNKILTSITSSMASPNVNLKSDF